MAPRDRARARVVAVRRWFPGVDATTLGRWIVVRSERSGDVTLLEHELVHVEQWRTWRAPAFLTVYLLDYARGRLGGAGHRRAYRAIRFEVEARARAGR